LLTCFYYQEAALKESNKSLRDQLSIFQNRCRELENELEISRIAIEAADKTTNDASADLQRLTETFEAEKMQSDLTIKQLQV
jgi:archaellum component FlaC